MPRGLNAEHEPLTKLVRSLPGQRAVWASPIVVQPPRLHDGPGIGQAGEPMLVQALVAWLAVEALDEPFLARLARIDEAQRHPTLVGPLIQRPAREFWPVVHDARSG